MISFKSDEKLVYDNISDTEERELKAQKQAIGENLIRLFYNIELNSCYIVEPEAIEIRNEYKKWLIEQYNATCEEDERIEIISREFKVMKLSCIYACLNHPKEYKIEVKDVEQAIISVQYLSEDFKAFKKFLQQKENDEYDKCYNFFKENIDKQFSMSDLKTKYFKEMGFTRKQFIEKFNSILDFVGEVAKQEGYFLERRSNANCNGYYYKLVKTDTSIGFDE